MCPRCRSVTSAPRLNASNASSIPIRPDALLVSMRTGSIGSAVAPPVMRTFLPASAEPPSARSTHLAISPFSAIFAFPSAITGSITMTPQRLRRSMLARTIGLYMSACMAGAIATGTPEPIAVTAHIETRLSGMPCAIFPMVAAVHGAISSRSAASPPISLLLSSLSSSL